MSRVNYVKAALFLLLLCSPSEANPYRRIEEKVQERFGEQVKVQKIRLSALELSGEPERIELQMEYGKSRAVAYLYYGEKRHQALLEVLWKVRVYIATEDIPKGSPVDIQKLRVEERFLRTVPSDINLSLQELENSISSTHISKGTLLRRSLLREIPAVRMGEVVQAVYRSGALEVSFPAVALESGRTGQIVRLKRENREMRGRVISRGTVEVVP